MTHCKIKEKENVFLWKTNLALGFEILRMPNLIREYMKGKVSIYSFR